MSVVVKFYNQKRYVERCLCSVFAQTYSPLEIIIVDDCSTDGTYECIQEVARNYAKSGGGANFVKICRNGQNLERAATLARGISLCHGELVFQVDGDDMCFPNRVEDAAAAWEMGGRKAAVIWSQCYEVDEDDRIVGERWNSGDRIPCIFGAVMAYRRDCLQMFPALTGETSRRVVDDWIWGVRALINSDVETLNVGKQLVLYRLGGMSSGSGGLRTSKINAVNGALRSIELLENEVRTVAETRGVSPEWQEVLFQYLAQYKHRGTMFLKKYAGTTFAERLDGMRNNPNGRFGATTLGYWLVDLPLLFFPTSWLTSWTTALHARLHQIKGRWHYRSLTRELEAKGVLPKHRD